MPHEGYADPVMNDRSGFHLDIAVYKLATRAIEASGVSSTPPVAETTDGVTREIMRLTTTGPKWLKGSSR